jgi:hypothetical protein
VDFEKSREKASSKYLLGNKPLPEKVWKLTEAIQAAGTREAHSQVPLK